MRGKQILTHSFFMRNFIGRKVIEYISPMSSANSCLVFEGGHKFSSGKHRYENEIASLYDLQRFSPFNLQSMILNPIYGYGKIFLPNDLCEEWHKVFLYLCATSSIIWTIEEFQITYKRFLKFLEDNICYREKGKVETILLESEFLLSLILYIDKFRSFLRGEDEPSISKELHQTLNTRYVYLKDLWELFPHSEQQSAFSAVVLQEQIKKAIQAENVYDKGVRWEKAVKYILEQINGWKITGSRVRTGAQEIDISIANVSLEDDLWQLGAYILVECKNWKRKIGQEQIRKLAYIANMKGNKTTLFFAAKGITGGAWKEIIRLALENVYILCITEKDMQKLKTTRDCKELILHKFDELKSMKEKMG